jgi:aldose 1-epimerase
MAPRPPATTVDGLQGAQIASPDHGLEATFVPSAGMVCCSLRHHGEELLAQRDGVRAYLERGATMGIPLLYPWANRLAGWSYSVGGQVVDLAEAHSLLALDHNGLPIHGVIARYLHWELAGAPVVATAAGGLRARMRWDRPDLLAVFPFPHVLELEARIDEQTLTVETTVRAGSSAPVPVSFGFHPYLTIPGADRSSWRVELPVKRRLQLDERMIPTGRSEPFDGEGFALQDSSWDDAFAGLTRPTRFAVSAAGRRIELEFLAGYPYAQLFSPRGADFICFEPMAAPTNALLNGVELPLLEPGCEFRAAFRISVSVAE